MTSVMNAVVPASPPSPTLSDSPSPPPPPGIPPLSPTEPRSPTGDVRAPNGSKTTRSGLVFPNMESQEQKFLAAFQGDRDDIVFDKHKSDGAYWARRNSNPAIVESCMWNFEKRKPNGKADPSSPRGLSQTLTNLPETSALKIRGDAGLSKTLPNLPETSALLQIRGDLSEMSTRGSYGAQFKGSRTSSRGSRGTNSGIRSPNSQGSVRRRSSMSALTQMTSSSNSLEWVRSSSLSSHSHDDLSELNSDGIMSSGEFSEESKSPERSRGSRRRRGSTGSIDSVAAEQANSPYTPPAGFERQRRGSKASACSQNSSGSKERSFDKVASHHSGHARQRRGSKHSLFSAETDGSPDAKKNMRKRKQSVDLAQEDRLKLQHLKEELLTEEADRSSPKRNMSCKTIGKSDVASEIASAGSCSSLAGDLVKQIPLTERSKSFAGDFKKRLSGMISFRGASEKTAKSEPLSPTSPAKSDKKPLGIMAKLRSLRTSITDVKIKDLVKLPTKVKTAPMPPRKPVGLNVAQIDAFEHKPVMRHTEYARAWRTRDVVEKVVKPSTLEQLCCYAEIVGQELGSEPQQAEYFVSHSWDMNFGNFVNCLALYIHEPVYTMEGVGPQTTFWIDIFAINQHAVMAGAAVPGSFGQNDPFVQVIAQSKGVVLLPANDFKAVGRVWCLYEVLTAMNYKRRIVTMFSHDDDMLIQSTNQPKRLMSTSVGQQIVDAETTLARRQFENRLQNAHSCIAALDVHSAKATMPEDRIRILAKIEAMPGGVSKMNDVLKQQLRDGLDNVARMVARCGL